MIEGGPLYMQKFTSLLSQISTYLQELLKQLKLYRKEVKLKVTKTYQGKEEDQENTLVVKTFVTNPATVTVSYGRTVNLGDFEFARIDMRLSLPCYVEEIPSTFSYADNMVKELLSQEVGALNGKESRD
jgi:hypothetical protein